MNKQQLVENICDLGDIGYETAAAGCIEQDINKYTEGLVANIKTKYEIVLTKDLKPGNVIIHNYSTFLIYKCDKGSGAGNEFGEYYSISGEFCRFNQPASFWSFDDCPIIKVN